MAGWALLGVLTGVVGTWLGLLVWGGRTVAAGPFTIELAAELGRGQTVVSLPPLGRLTADTHTAPLTIKATLQGVNVRALAERLEAVGVDGIADDTEHAVRDAIVSTSLRLVAIAAGITVALAVLVFRRRWRHILIAVLAAVVLTAGSEVEAWATYRPARLLAPTFSGSISLAPKLIGPATQALGRLDDIRLQLSRIVEGAVRVYTSLQPVGLPEEDQIRVLHVSDIHLSPLGMSFALQLAETFDVDLVVDTGDLTSFGTPVENLVLTDIHEFGRPYVFVRGNHDSASLQSALGGIPNAIVLDGQARTVAGLLVYGLGDPVFTPNKQALLDDAGIARVVTAAGLRVKGEMQGLPRPPDIVAVHDDRMAEAVAGLVPLVISGHFHQQRSLVENGTLYLRDGSTGGAGANVFTEVGGIPLEAEILTFAKTSPPHLVSFDLVQQSPETGSITIARHLVSEDFGTLVPSPSPSSVLSPSPTPTSP